MFILVEFFSKLEIMNNFRRLHLPCEDSAMDV